MNMFKTKVSVLAMAAALMVPAAAGAAPASASTTSGAAPDKPDIIFVGSVPQTNVNGIYVPGYYLVTKDSKAAFIPGGVGLVVVNSATALPIGAYYVK
ncbi:hypothetical protein SK3146_00120 [Paenibacillus konkukensis]|uniref:Secreted protein n=1 Tax=Paenibacillus konkukensis TaxID=2020716 RepID=A0ABY4RE05_9BACL|nr:hypothetical protein [Paenibacillus konkukensis]UQZ80964.1 hypothetical protein SK3146_00120 [Paenibacillus konkukensis]